MSLPSEIYTLIFSLINRNELLKLATVKKEWTLPALHLYYQKVSLGENNTEKLKALLYQESGLRYSHWIEIVNIHSKEYRDFDSDFESDSDSEFNVTMLLTKQEFQRFFSYLPNVKKIEFSGGSMGYKYMEHLLDIDTSQSLTRLEDIDFGDYKFNLLDYSYWSVYYHFRFSLTQILLMYDNNSVFAAPYGGLLNYISQFKKLTYLLYTNDTRLPVTIYDIQLACPALTSLEFHDKATTLSFQAGGDTFYKYSSLKNLSISYASIPQDYIEHIIKDLPKSLESLEIKMNAVDMFDWIDQVGIDNVLKLVKRMNKLSNACLYFDPGIRYRRRQTDLKDLDITTFFKILHVFKGEKNMLCTANCLEMYPFRSSMHFAGKNLFIHYGLTMASIFRDWVFQLAVPDKTVSNIGLEIIHSMTFNIYEIDKEIPLKVLDYSLNNCPNLQFVDFIVSSDPYRQITLSSSKKYYYYKKNYDLSTTSKENLKVVKISRIVPSQEFVDFLAVHLPYMHTFTSTSINYNRRNHERYLTDLTIDLRPFKSLQTVYFDIELFLYDLFKETCLIKFAYTDGEVKYYSFTSYDTVASFTPISLEEVSSIQVSPLGPILFRCDKIEKFTLLYGSKDVLFDIIRGIPQKNRKKEKCDIINYFNTY